MTSYYVSLWVKQLLSETFLSTIKNKKVIGVGYLKWFTLYIYRAIPKNHLSVKWRIPDTILRQFFLYQNLIWSVVFELLKEVVNVWRGEYKRQARVSRFTVRRGCLRGAPAALSAGRYTHTDTHANTYILSLSVCLSVSLSLFLSFAHSPVIFFFYERGKCILCIPTGRFSELCGTRVPSRITNSVLPTH